MKNFFKLIFSFSRREKRGIYVLLTLIFLLVGFRYFYLPRQDFEKEFDHSSFKEDILSFQHSLRKKQENRTEPLNVTRDNDYDNNVTNNHELFNFNPNKLNRRGWKKLGLHEGLIDVIENFRKSGGYFYVKEDLKKIYGLDQDLYNKLEPYIVLPDSLKAKRNVNKQENKKRKNKFNRKDTVINLNKADTFNLLLVHGIGPYYAKRICKYRDLLGGFSNIEQLKEVYGINDTVYNKINKSLKVDTSDIEKIHLNNTTFEELISHPYIDSYHTKAILEYIEYKGTIQTTEELVENNILDEQTYNKLSIYIEP